MQIMKRVAEQATGQNVRKMAYNEAKEKALGIDDMINTLND